MSETGKGFVGVVGAPEAGDRGADDGEAVGRVAVGRETVEGQSVEGESVETKAVEGAAEAVEIRPWQPVAGRWRVLIAGGTLLLEAGVLVRLGAHWSTWPVAAFAATAVALVVIDFAILRLPNALTAPTAVAVIAALVAEALAAHHPHRLLAEVEGALALGLFYMLLYALSRGGLGLGDVKVGAIAGMLLGSRGWVDVFNGTFLAYAITLVIALVMLRRGRKRFPYGPGLIAGAMIVLLAG